MATQALTERTPAGDVKLIGVVIPDTEPLGTAYGPSPEQAAFFKAQTGIDDDDDLRNHILEVQEKAYQVRDVVSF